MSETMNAIVMTGPNEYGLQQVPIPEPGFQEVLVKVKAVSICGSDPKIFNGGYMSINWPPAFPFTPGHEWAGEVVALGDGATGFEVGDRVAGEAHCGCGICDNCQAGMYNLCMNYGKQGSGHHHYGFNTQGAYADYNVYNVKAITKIPDNISYEEASLTDTAGTSLQAIRLTGVKPGGYSLILGPGPIGIIAMQIVKAMGSKTIMVGRKGRLALAGKLGADHLINYEECDDVVARVREITGGLGVDQAYECAGTDVAIPQCIKSCKKNGQVALLSLPANDDHVVPTKTMVMNQIHMHGSRANPNVSKDVLNMMADGSINVKDMITDVFPLQQFDQALKTFVERINGAMKVVVKPNEKA